MSTSTQPGALVRILNPIEPVFDHQERRLWLEAGVPAIVGHKRTLTLLQDWGSEGAEPYLRLDAENESMRLPVAHGAAYNCTGWLGLCLYPLALEYADGNAQVARVRLQFVRTDASVRWAS